MNTFALYQLRLSTLATNVLLFLYFFGLYFTGPFVAPVNQALRLTNRSDKRVGFKVKTTAPTRYCVRPNAGLLDPSESASVTSMQNFPNTVQSIHLHDAKFFS